MASSPSSLLLPLGSVSCKRLSSHAIYKVRGLVNVRCSSQVDQRAGTTSSATRTTNLIKRREVISLVFGVSSLSLLDSFQAKAAGLPPEEKPRLCDETCEKELENVW
ncbi:hypothetical protein Tsubulata_041896 [Turnera subulata]|uniref:Uncharacterized protein n=1 Tax=Turnera subulata TaxID=218843 RepID=A0A9Q0JK00_9ROSI|nr:hypothetical protein Tsubulata_041896 [Turnera subulata]